MKKLLFLLACAWLATSMTMATKAGKDSVETPQETTDQPTVKLGYVILYVKDVSASLSFYENAFGLKRRFFNDTNGMAYGELETGAARLAFASLELARANLKSDVVVPSPDKEPLAFEVALVTADVQALYARATEAGATSVGAPATKPWGQTVAYVRDKNGYVIEICSPLP